MGTSTTVLRGRWALAASPATFALVCVVFVADLVAETIQAAVPSAPDNASIIQWFCMPVLALAVFLASSAPRSRLVRLTLVALGFSWLGDAVPDLFSGDASFLAMIGFFLCAQVTYIAAFWPYRASSVAGVVFSGRHRTGERITADSSASRRTGASGSRWVLAPYCVVFVLLVALCAPGAGALLGPVIIYGACLVSMAVLATGVNRLVAIGGAVFLMSDALIALRSFVDGFALPADGVWVMATYLVGQLLIAEGVLRRARVSSAR